MDEQTRQRLVAEETNRFLNDGFGQLDLSGSPNLQQQLPKDDPFAASDRHGFNNVDLGQANPLKQFAQNPDAETLDRVAAETGDSELAGRLEEERVGTETQAFLAAQPSYLPDDDNLEAMEEFLAARNLPWTRQNLAVAFKALCRAGKMKMPRGHAKTLADNERLHVIALCKSGQLEDAITTFIGYALPDAEDDYEGDVTAFLSDPASLPVRNASCRFCWFHTRAISDSEAWRQFERDWFKQRPVKTVADLDAAYAEFLKSERSVARDRLVYANQRETPSPENVAETLEDLDDQQIEKLTEQTRRHMARKSRRSNGVLV